MYLILMGEGKSWSADCQARKGIFPVQVSYTREMTAFSAPLYQNLHKNLLSARLSAKGFLQPLFNPRPVDSYLILAVLHKIARVGFQRPAIADQSFFTAFR